MEKLWYVNEDTLLILKKVWRQMRITSILLFIITLCVQANTTHSQNALVNLELENATLPDVFREIEKQSDYRFFYNKNVIDETTTVNLNTGEKEIATILEQLLKNTDMSYELVDKYIVITTAKDESTIPLPQQETGRLITGKVTDEYGEPIIGASLIEKGTHNGIVTDVDGNFSIRVSDEAILEVSYIGYLKQDITVGNRTTIQITLRENVQVMDEVVVIGYGTVKRAHLAGAVSTTDSKTFQSRPVQNAAAALQGEMAGLTVIRSGGAPGSEPTIRVRDVSSINGGSPLVLIDGAEGSLNMINPADIENISVLKDGTAAIYGARAADGVILITTKAGRKNQKMRVSFDANYSIKKPALLKKPANLYQHAMMALEITDGSFPIEYTQDELELIRQGSDIVLPASNWGRWSGYPKFYKDQDWNDMIIGNGNLQTYNVSLTGGGEKYSYLISLGHQREEGLPKFGTDLDKRYFVRAKSNIQLLSNLEYDLNISYEASSRDYSSGISEGQNIWELIYKTRSWTPMYNPAGNFYTFEGFDNPAQLLEEGGLSNRTTGNFTFNNQLRWNVIDGLNIIGRAIVRKSDADKYIQEKMLYSYNWDNVNHRTARTPNAAERNYQKTLSKNFTIYAEYKKLFASKHEVGIMAGGSHESENYDRFWAKRINFDQQESMPLGLGSAEDQVASSTGNAWTINSFFSRLNYAFADKYLIEGTLRADGSSRFAPGSRWGYFPGVNAAWRIGEESFVKNLDIFDELKVRGSYGEMGNQSGINHYDYIELITLYKEYYPFGNGQKGQMAKQSNLVSSSRTWETIETKNIGVDFSVLNNRLFGSFDYFWKRNKNMLIPVTYPAVLGIEAPATNSGELKIRGWEIVVGWRDRIGDFNYSVRASVSDAQNEVSKRVGSNVIKLGWNDTNPVVGYPLNSCFGYVFDGIIQNEQQLADYKSRFPLHAQIQNEIGIGDAMYKDLDGDGNLTTLGDGTDGAGDVVYLGNSDPRYSFGLNLNAEYKGFDFGAFIQGVGKRTMFLEGDASRPFDAPWYQSAEYWYGKTWTAERTDARYPAITNNDKKYYNYEKSTNTRHNVRYARLKNIQLGYTIPKKETEKFKLEKVRVYFSGEDLFEVHNAPGGWDPENSGKFDMYPFSRNFSVGVNVVF